MISTVHAIISWIWSTYALTMTSDYSGTFGKVARFHRADTVKGDATILLRFVPISLGYFSYLVVMSTDKRLRSTLAMLHHFLSCLVWPISILTSSGCFYVLTCLFAELSTPFVNMSIFFLPRAGIDGLAKVVFGLVLIVVFFICRVLPSPMILYTLWSSWNFWDDVDPVIHWISLAAIPIPCLMFWYWFYLVAAAVKVLMPSPESQDKKVE